MLKSSFISRFLLSATILCAPFTVYQGAKAVQFEQSEVNAQLFIAIARPYGDKKHDLLILQQIPGKQQCWQEQGANPTTVVPLLLNFDFTGICDRSTDSNGYSIRIDGKDLGLEYLLKVVEKDGDLWLVGTPRLDPRQPEVIIGRTHGIKAGFLKIQLEPGWRFTKRSFKGQVLGHVYLTGDRTVLQTSATNPTRRLADDRLSPNRGNLDPSSNSQPLKELVFTADSALSNNPNRTAVPPLPVSPERLSNRAPLPPVSNRAPLSPLPVPASNLPPTTYPQQPAQALPPRSTNGRSLPPVPVPRSPSAAPTPLAAQPLPPLPTSPTSTNAPVLPPPPVANNATPLPNPRSQRSLSDVMTVSPRGGAAYRTTEPSNIDRSTIARQSTFRVLVNPGNQQEQVRSRYPDAFATNYQGRSLWQIGRFSSQENAQKALNDLSGLGVQGIIVP